jgi:multidrug efflux pump subunit AcrA (membrane-fusion protein)
MKQVAMLVLVLALTLAGCGENEAVVPVVQMRMLTQAGAAAEHYAGVVVSQRAVQVQRDLTQTVAELCVAEGDEVRQGDVLFRYDSDALDLALDKQELELDRLEASIKDTKSQIAQVEKELKNTKDESLKTQLNIQLRQLQNNLKEAQYSQEDLEFEIKRTKELLKDIDVKSPISGTVRAIDESGDAYITIQQAGAYQVQGSVNELSLNSGIQVGAEVVVVSRLDENKTWTGQVVSVDYNSGSGNSYDDMYGNSDSLTGSTSYPFTVVLDSDGKQQLIYKHAISTVVPPRPITLDGDT